MLNKKDYLYLDENQEHFSNIGLGCIIEKIGEQQKIAYIDVQNTAKKLINFLENLSLSHSFTTNFRNFHLDIFVPRKKAIQKTLLPNVEYLNITKSIFLNQINDYDVIIVDNYLNIEDSLISLDEILKAKNESSQLVVLTPDVSEFKEMKSKFSNKIVCSYKRQKNLFTRPGLVNITGRPKGKTLLPNVEYLNITRSIFLEQINDYDVVIVDNYVNVSDSLISLDEILKIKNESTQLIVLTPDESEFKEIKSNFSNRIVCSYKKQKNLFTRPGLVNITGRPKGKTLFSLGYLIRKYLYKSDVKLVYFDKGSDVFGDAKFFDALKKWNLDNTFYGTFDFVKTGIDIKDKKDIELNKKEARDALMLFETALKKQAPVVGDEINTVLKKGYVEVSKVVDILKNTKNEVILTGETSKVEISKITELRVVLKKSV